MARLPMTDTARSMLSLAVSLPLIVPLIWLSVATPFFGGPYSARGGQAGDLQAFVIAYLIIWPSFTFVYLAWTYWSLSRVDEVTLRVYARRDHRTVESPLMRWIGLAGVVNSSVVFSATAVLITILSAQAGLLSGSTWFVALAFLTVASSWGLVSYSFALAYLRLDAAGTPEGGQAFTLGVPRPYRFGDYLTIAFLASTMAALINITPASRAAWRLVATNTVVAFGFNSVIIAMMVSLLFGGISD